MWKVEVRRTCKICGKPIKNKRSRTFCSKKCRTRSYTIKYREQRSTWQRNRQDEKAAKPSSRKKQCGICHRWYVQVGTHIVQRHGMTAREYREEYRLPLKRGIVPRWYRNLKGDQALSNGTVANLKRGKKFWYKKGDRRARVKKMAHGFKSVAHLPKSNLYE